MGSTVSPDADQSASGAWWGGSLTENSHLVALIVDDGTPETAVCTEIFLTGGYRIHVVSTTAQAVSYIEREAVSIMLIASHRPAEVFAQLHEFLSRWRGLAVLVVSIDNRELTVANLLDMGADDYLIPPLRPIELVARCRSAMRRSITAYRPPLTFADGLVVDNQFKIVEVRGEVVQLPRKQRALIELLAKRPGAVVSHHEIMRAVWGDEHMADLHYMRVLIKKLRHRIERNPSSPRIILTEQGVGYRLALPGEIIFQP